MIENNQFAITIFFKNVFPSLDDFKTFVSEYTSLEESVLHEYLYKRLMNRYCNENVNYSTIDSFKRNFAITYEDNFKQYEFRKRMIYQMYNLTEAELVEANRQVQNMALNNNEVIDESKDPLDVKVNFISHQNSSKTDQNKMEAYIAAMSSITTLLLNDMLERFRKHFMTVYFNQQYMYHK